MKLNTKALGMLLVQHSHTGGNAVTSIEHAKPNAGKLTQLSVF